MMEQHKFNVAHSIRDYIILPQRNRHSLSREVPDQDMEEFNPRKLSESWFEQHKSSLVWWETKRNNYWGDCIHENNVAHSIRDYIILPQRNRHSLPQEVPDQDMEGFNPRKLSESWFEHHRSSLVWWETKRNDNWDDCIHENNVAHSIRDYIILPQRNRHSLPREVPDQDMEGFNPRKLSESWFEQHKSSLVWWETKRNNYWDDCIHENNVAHSIRDYIILPQRNRHFFPSRDRI
jgi:hypothetical protein